MLYLLQMHFAAQYLLKVGLLTPSASIEDLQLLDPKDGKAVKAIPRANSGPTNTKSALGLLQERVAQEKQVNTETVDNSTIDSMNWIDTIGTDIGESSDGRTRPMAPSGLPEPTKVTQTAQEESIAAEPQMKKKSTLSLQAYSQRNQADSLPDPVSVADQGSPTSQASAIVPGALQPTAFVLPKSSTKVLPRVIFQPSGYVLPGPVSILRHHLSVLLGHTVITPWLLYIGNADSENSHTIFRSPTKFASPVEVQPSDPHPLPSENTQQSGYFGPNVIPPTSVDPPPTMAPIPSVPFPPKITMEPGVDPIIYSFEREDIYGTLLGGTERMPLGEIRFRGLDLSSRKKLLANKTGPRENVFWFSHMCTAADYESHFHPVRFCLS